MCLEFLCIYIYKIMNNIYTGNRIYVIIYPYVTQNMLLLYIRRGYFSVPTSNL